jgi:hypothetical protein
MMKQFAVIFVSALALAASAGAQVLDPKGGGYRGSTMEALDAARLSPGPVAQPPHMGASIYNGQYNPNGFNPYFNGQYSPYANPGYMNGVVPPYTQLPYPNNGYAPGAGYYQNGYPYANGNVPYNWNGNVPYNWSNIIDPLFRR